MNDALSSWPDSSYAIRSYSAPPTPCATPPWICPSTMRGLISVPQSCTTQYRSTLISAVCGSVSTIAACMPLAKVDRTGEKNSRPSRPGASPSATGGLLMSPPANWVAALAASSNAYLSGLDSTATVPIEIPDSGSPLILTIPSLISMSSGDASSAAAATLIALARAALAASATADPLITAALEANVPTA